MAALADEVIGRAAERTELGVFADTVASGPAALMLEGEAGAGKTTLWLAGCELARSLGYHVLAARPAAPEARLAFAGLGDLLGGVLDEALDVLPPPQAHALRVALVLEAPGDARLDERVLGVSALSALRALGAARPVLLAVDDVQWLDPASARVLAFAWRRLDDGPGGLLLAHRTGEPVPHQLAGLAPLRRVSVGPLDAGDVHRLLRSRLGLVLPRPTVARVHAVAGGNPFLALEVGRELEAGADFPSVPDRLLELVEDRIAGLPHATREALAATAALALPTLELVAAAGGDEALGPAFAAHVVELDGDRLRFTHPLLAAAASTAIDPVGRRALLRRLAGTVADEDERARLQALVTDGPDREVAGALERAAGRAQGRGASAVAAQLCEQSRDLTPPGATADADRRALQAASYHWTAGDVERARSTLEDASRQASTPVARAEALTELAWVHLFQSDEPHGAALARRALEELGPHAPARPHALNCLSTAHQLMLEDLEEAARLSDEAVAFARRSGDANGLSENLCGVAYAAALRGHPRTESALAEAEALGPRAWGWRAVGWPSSHRAAADWWADRTEASVAESRRIEAQALHRGDAGSIPTILAYRAPVEYAAGRWPEADATATEGIEAAAQAGEPLNQALALAARALVRASTGRSDDARADAEGALAIA
ncbi:MAG: AAA family ATPase, partial [Solirubrobacteraceae bacterium]